MKISSVTSAASLLAAALLPLAAHAEIPLIDDLVKQESWSYVPVSARCLTPPIGRGLEQVRGRCQPMSGDTAHTHAPLLHPKHDITERELCRLYWRGLRLLGNLNGLALMTETLHVECALAALVLTQRQRLITPIDPTHNRAAAAPRTRARASAAVPTTGSTSTSPPLSTAPTRRGTSSRPSTSRPWATQPPSSSPSPRSRAP